MNISFKENFWLILGVCLTAVVLFYQDWKMRSPEDDVTKIFPLYDVEDVQRVVLTQEGKELIWEKKGEGQLWWQVSPHEVLGDQKVINELVRTTTVIRSAYEVDPSPSLLECQGYGFEHPLFSLTLIFKNGDQVALKIGSKTPLQDVYYAMSSRWESIFLIESRELSLWQSGETSFRFRYVVPEDVKSVKEMFLMEKDDKLWHVRQNSEDQYILLGADQQNVTKSFQRFLFDLKVKEFEDIKWFSTLPSELVYQLKYRLSLDGDYDTIVFFRKEGDFWIQNPYGEGYYMIEEGQILNFVWPSFGAEKNIEESESKLMNLVGSQEDESLIDKNNLLSEGGE